MCLWRGGGGAKGVGEARAVVAMPSGAAGGRDRAEPGPCHLSVVSESDHRARPLRLDAAPAVQRVPSWTLPALSWACRPRHRPIALIDGRFHSGVGRLPFAANLGRRSSSAICVAICDPRFPRSSSALPLSRTREDGLPGQSAPSLPAPFRTLILAFL